MANPVRTDKQNKTFAEEWQEFADGPLQSLLTDKSLTDEKRAEILFHVGALAVISILSNHTDPDATTHELVLYMMANVLTPESIVDAFRQAGLIR